MTPSHYGQGSLHGVQFPGAGDGCEAEVGRGVTAPEDLGAFLLFQLIYRLVHNDQAGGDGGARL
jgi:hypothetical protein